MLQASCRATWGQPAERKQPEPRMPSDWGNPMNQGHRLSTKLPAHPQRHTHPQAHTHTLERLS